MHLEHRWGWQEISSQWVWSSLPRMQVSPLFPLQGQLLWETGEDAANPWLLRFILLMGHFIVLTFRSLMHFQLILTHGVRWDPTSFFYMWTCTYTSITVEKLGLHWIVLEPLNPLIVNMRVSFQTFNSILSIHISTLTAVPCCFDYCSFIVIFKTEKCHFSNFTLLLKYCFGDPGSLQFISKF